jgi:hypothetical protein
LALQFIGGIPRLEQNQHRKFSAQVHHARVQDIRTARMKMSRQFPYNPGPIRPDRRQNELGHDK